MKAGTLPSDDWLVQDCTIDNADCVYAYDFERGLWQTGQPAMRLRFVNIKETRITRPRRILGDEQRQFELTLENVTSSCARISRYRDLAWPSRVSQTP